MNKSELQKILQTFQTTEHVEDVFGVWEMPTLEKLNLQYRLMVKPIFPDHFRTKPELLALAEEAFKLLGQWKIEAEDRIKAGTYGDRTKIKPVKITTRSDEYEIRSTLASGDISNLYGGQALKSGKPVIVKVIRNPKNNDLGLNEARALKAIFAGPAAKTKAVNHVPKLLASFELRQNKMRKQVLVFEDRPGFVTWADVIAAYPRGIHPADAAWMVNRILGALVAASEVGLVHGAITPAHILIRPEDHNGILLDWSYSVKTGDVIKAIVPAFRANYPPEVLTKKPASPGTDIFMLAQSVIQLLGSHPGHVGALAVPRALRGLLQACSIPSARYRTSDIGQLCEDFGQVLRDLYGPPAFRPFAMPPA